MLNTVTLFKALNEYKNETDPSPPPPFVPVPLAYTFYPALNPVTCNVAVLYIHGLDSSQTTWSKILSNPSTTPLTDSSLPPPPPAQVSQHRKHPSFTIDIRGHGETSIGPTPLESYTSEAVTLDIVHFLNTVACPYLNESNPDVFKKGYITNFVIIGHSMGGRISMLLAAHCNQPEFIHPDAVENVFGVSSIVVEDMDVSAIEQKVLDDGFWKTHVDANGNFDRQFESNVECFDFFVKCGYDSARVKSWFGSRIREVKVLKETGEDENGLPPPPSESSSYFWSDINPQAHHLSFLAILATTCGSSAMNALSLLNWGPNVTLLIAGKGKTVTKHESTDIMKRKLKGLDYLSFENAEHSIHGSEQEGFLGAICGVLKQEVERLKVAESGAGGGCCTII